MAQHNRLDINPYESQINSAHPADKPLRGWGFGVKGRIYEASTKKAERMRLKVSLHR